MSKGRLMLLLWLSSKCRTGERFAAWKWAFLVHQDFPESEGFGGVPPRAVGGLAVWVVDLSWSGGGAVVE